MKSSHFFLAGAMTLALSASPVLASSGIFGSGVVISENIGGSGSLDLFELTLLGDSRHAPNTGGGGVSLGAPALISSGGWDNATANLGSFNPLAGDTLVLDGGEQLTFKNGGSDVTGSNLYYSIDGGTFSSAISFAFNEDNVNGAGGDQRWYTDGANVNLLSGLLAGSHTLTVYLDAPSTDGTHFANNGGSNYTANFSVVPEPSSFALILGSFVAGASYLIRRKRS